ncbi:hypothetical protein [Pedosphaera parvula]|uniref:Uncharacterized protein n=1 Tax=Pedosphaera parvula (strain Ellin514) TaxID=320771 RepID=B9XKG3_PEDPL|nr:hypothetical protein [Pedosphaera parvula]EEF59633.1 hypothetical protein Cflav_PD2622 [Pedosphaera parvula Ellin514]
MREPTKSEKRKLRELSMQAHEEELRRALLPVDALFDEWKQGKVSSGELAIRIHDWDRGPAFDLYKKYNYGELQLNVAWAVAHGVLDSQKLGPQLLEMLQGLIEYCQPAPKQSPSPDQEG